MSTQEEIAAKSLYEAEAREHKDLYDLEMKSRSKLGRRVSGHASTNS